MISNLHVGVVPTTIIHPTMVKGLNDLVVYVPKKAFRRMTLSAEKYLSSRGGSSSRFIIPCPATIELVIRINKHFMYKSNHGVGYCLELGPSEFSR